MEHMATSRLFLYMNWAPVPGRTCKPSGPERDSFNPRTGQNCPKSVQTRFSQRPYKSSSGHVIINGAPIAIPFESGMDDITAQPVPLQNRSGGFRNPEKSD